MSNYIPSISESFNAKATSTSELCNTFISNEYFDKLSSPNSAIMIGPRGSGKTTLMRMLEVESLEIWDKDISEYFRSNIGFSGVFIPTDRFWKTQYEKVVEVIGNDSSNLNMVDSLFVYHVLERFIATVSFRASRTITKANRFRSVDISKEDEAELVYDLSMLWNVKPRIPSIRNLIISITLKKQDISTYISKLFSGQSINYSKPDILDGELIGVLNASVQIVNSYFDEKGHKWAFLFDELELAPNEIVQPLLDSMRGGPEDIVFKLALSPYHKGVSITNTPDSSMKEQDTRVINLTGTSNGDGPKFSKTLCENIFIRAGLTNPIESYFDESPDIDRFKECKELEKKDPSFAEYLKDKDLIPDDFSSYKEDKMSLVRKIQYIARLRNSHLTEQGRKKSLRRAPDFYAGFDNICKATEYNPRMLIGMMSMFVPIIKDKGVVSIHKQIECLDSYFDSFKALLSTIAIDSTHPDFNTIFDFINTIAEYFKNEIHSPVFKADPKGVIVIKRAGNNAFIDPIGFALNAGALIADKQDVGSFQDVVDIKNSKCRLSNIFAHHFRLLTTKQKQIDLVELLSPTRSVKQIRVVEPTSSEAKQLELL